jgi:2-polyprenyl-3-methyl-5-hydroxy-6-metoxy-1,4-benzoquinol methylase
MRLHCASPTMPLLTEVALGRESAYQAVSGKAARSILNRVGSTLGEIIPRPQPQQALEFNGERFTSAFGGQTAIEHWHRYLLARELVRERDVLDIACGEGYGSALLAQTARSVVGVDLSATTVAHAQSSYAGPNLRYLEGNALQIPLAEASVDMVVSFETLEHFREHHGFMQEIKRVLRPCGTLLISTPDRDNYSPSATPPNEYHQLELTTEEFLRLLRQYFSSVTAQGQRVLLGSALLSDGASSQPPLCFERRGDAHFETSSGLARAKYRLAIASNGEPPTLPDSVFVDSDQLFYIDGPWLERNIAAGVPPLSAARVEDLERVVRLRDDELSSSRAEEARLVTELNALTQDRDRLAGAFHAADQDRHRLANELVQLRDAIFRSASWRLTAPLRRASQILSRRR